MGRFDDISLAELQELKEETEGEVPRERVLAAIGRKQGDNIDRLAERHDVAEKTIRNWLDRFVEQPLTDAPYDEDRPGRPAKLSDEERTQLFDELQSNPTELGYDRQAWTTVLAKHHIKEQYDTEYTDRHVRELMNNAGLSWRKARPRHDAADPAAEAEFKRTVQKNDPS